MLCIGVCQAETDSLTEILLSDFPVLVLPVLWTGWFGGGTRASNLEPAPFRW